MTASTRSHLIAWLGCALALSLGSTASAGAGSPRSLVIHANGPIGPGTFMVAEVKGSLAPGLYTLKHGANGAPAPAEVFRTGGQKPSSR